MKQANPDIQVENHGSIFLFQPLTDSGSDWLSENIGDEAMYFGNALAVEHRFAENIADGMASDGLKLITF